MKTFNGIRFAKNEAELVESLFNPSGTASGIYKKTKNGTKFYRANGELFAYAVHNPKQGYFMVSARMFNGKPIYCYGLSYVDGCFFGLSGSLAEESSYIKSWLSQFPN